MINYGMAILYSNLKLEEIMILKIHFGISKKLRWQWMERFIYIGKANKKIWKLRGLGGYNLKFEAYRNDKDKLENEKAEFSLNSKQ